VLVGLHACGKPSHRVLAALNEDVLTPQ
jgi:hypothetical protein